MINRFYIDVLPSLDAFLRGIFTERSINLTDTLLSVSWGLSRVTLAHSFYKISNMFLCSLNKLGFILQNPPSFNYIKMFTRNMPDNIENPRRNLRRIFSRTASECSHKKVELSLTRKRKIHIKFLLNIIFPREVISYWTKTFLLKKFLFH